MKPYTAVQAWDSTDTPLSVPGTKCVFWLEFHDTRPRVRVTVGGMHDEALEKAIHSALEGHPISVESCLRAGRILEQALGVEA